MTYYIFAENGSPNGAGQCECLNEDVINIEVDEELYNDYIATPDKYIYQDGEIIIDPDYEEKQKQKEREQFLRDFFNTSLGWVRRKVTMKTGEIKDFLSDVLPMLVVGIPILTYTEEGEQNKVLVTEEFIEECKAQYLKDFYGE